MSAHAERMMAQRDAWMPDAAQPANHSVHRALVVLPRSEQSVFAARALTIAMCWFVSDVLDTADVALVTGELVANSVRHTKAPPGTPDTVTVAIVVSEQELRIEVGDLDPRFPSGSAVAWDEENGRGMGLVEALCDEYSVQAFAGGKISRALWRVS